MRRWALACFIPLVALACAVRSGGDNTNTKTDPQPLTVKEMTDTLARATGRRLVTIPLPRALAKGALRRIPPLYRLMRIPPEAVDYFAHPTHYLTDHTRADLAGSGIEVPPFQSYAARLVEFVRGHPEVGSAAMV